MKAGLHFVVAMTFLIGLLLTGLLGTSTSTTFIWPAYFVLGLSGTLAITVLFEKVSFRLPSWPMVAVLIGVGYVLIRASESPVAYFAREDAALVVACFLGYVGFASLFTSMRWRRGLVVTFAAMVVVNLVFAMLQKTIAPEFWLIPGYERTATTGVGGLFNQPDHFAGFLAALVPLWLSFGLFSREKMGNRRLWMGLAMVSILGVLLSGSIGGILAMAVGMLAFSVFAVITIWPRLKRGVQQRGLLAFAILLIVTSLGLFAGSGQIAAKLGHGISAVNGEAALPKMWQAGISQIEESPWLGTGGRTSYIFGRLFRSPELGSEIAEPEFVHNEFLQLIADYGILGFLLLATVLVLHLRLGWRFVKGYAGMTPPPGKLIPQSGHLALVIGAFGMLGTLGCLATFDFIFHLPIFAVMGALLLAIFAVPDPMANALSQEQDEPVFHGGGFLFAGRAVAFGLGLAMVVLGLLFSRSEYHYEMARLAFEDENKDFTQFRHLKMARDLDPKNPLALSLSAHAHVAEITPEMPLAERYQALETADQYFSKARSLYPQDVFAAVGHAAVLDELGEKSRAERRLSEALEWAPLYGNLMLAKAEHHLRYGEVAKAERAFQRARETTAFRDVAAADEGLRTIEEWKLIAMENGIQWQESDPNQRSLPDAQIVERAMAGALPNPPEEIPDPPANP